MTQRLHASRVSDEGAPRFAPWIGEHYPAGGGALGVPVLILGEAHSDGRLRRGASCCRGRDGP